MFCIVLYTQGECKKFLNYDLPGIGLQPENGSPSKPDKQLQIGR